MKFGKYEAEKRKGTYNDVVGIKLWVIGFKNGYEASVISGKYTYTDEYYPYELAVLKNGALCYDTPITNDVIGYLTADEVGEILEKIEARQSLKTIAQYCAQVDCYKCEIKDACEAIEAQLLPFCRLSEAMRKEGGKTMITDNEAIKAMNTLIDYCTQIMDKNPIEMDGESYLKVCDGCKISSKCDYLREGHTLYRGPHLPLEGIVEAKELAPNMAAAIMNRKD